MRKWLLRIALAIVALVLAAVAGVLLYVRTESFRVLLRDQVVAAADGAIRGDLRVGAVEGSIWSHLALRDVRIAQGGEDVLVVPELRLRYALLALIRGRLEITGIEVVDPAVRLRQNEEGVWNLAEALQPTAPAVPPAAPAQEATGLPIDVAISSVDLGAGRIEITPAGEPSRTFLLDDVHLAADAHLGKGPAGATEVKLRDLSARLTGGDIPPVELAARAALEGLGERTRIDVQTFDVRMPESAVHLDGRVDDLAAMAVDAELRIERLAVAEMKRLTAALPGGTASWPLAVDLAATAKVSGERRDLHAEIGATAGSAVVRVDASGDLSAAAPIYRAELELEKVDPAELLGRTDMAGVLGGRAEVSGQGSDPRAAHAQATLRATGLHFADANLGDLATEVRFDAGEASAVADLVGSGRAHLEGKVSVNDERYDLRLDADRVDLGRIGGAAAKAPPGEINLAAHVTGTGFAPETAKGKAEVDVKRSRIGEVVVDRGRLEAEVAEAKAHIATLDLRASGATLRVKGDVGLASGAPIRLDTDLQVPDIGPWLDLVKQTGSGQVTAQTSLRGTRSALAADARVAARDVRAAGVELGAADVDAALTGIGAGSPVGKVRADLDRLTAGVVARRISLGVELEPAKAGAPPRADLAVDADLEQGPQHLRASVAYGPEIAVDLRELALVAPGGAWKLDRPAKIVRDEKRIAVSNLRLSSQNGGSLSADGALGAKAGGGEGLRVRIAALDLTPFQVFAGEAVKDLDGFVDADILVGGSLEQIEPSGRLRVRDGRAEVVPLGVKIDTFGLDTRLAPDRIDIAGLSARAGEGRVDLRGDVSLRERRPDAIDLHLSIENWPAIATDRYEARVAAKIDANGPLAGPTVDGRIEVLSARLRPPMSLPGSWGPPPRDASIVVVQERKEAAPEKGVVTAAAQQTDVFRDSSIRVDVVIDRGTWIEKDDSSLELEGNLTFRKDRGDLDPALTGDVRTVRGWLYLYARRFEAERGVVSFTGGRKIDPVLDVELRSRVSDYIVKTIVSGTATKPVLKFESEPHLEDADVLALLMFGRPIHELGEGEKAAFQDQAVGIAGNYVAGELARSLGESLGFRVSELDVTKGIVGVGRYVTPDIYVSVQQSVTGKASRQLQAEYYVTPSWTLKTEADTTGESGLDVFWKKQY